VNSPRAKLESSLEINAPAHLAYSLWADCENFPKFMLGVEEVTRVDAHHLHWRARIWGEKMEWEAEILEEIPNERIIWRTITGDRMIGTVSFTKSGEHRVQIAHEIQLQAMPDAAETLAMTTRIKEDLERFRDFVESQWQG
jgi:uncharacterized membrane protein